MGTANFFRYVNDVIRTIRLSFEASLRDFVIRMHENLKFTLEQPDNQGSIVFLDMKISRRDYGGLSTQWFKKNTDTGAWSFFMLRVPISRKGH